MIVTEPGPGLPDPATLEPHELALLFPPYSETQMAELIADLKANGMSQPIVLLEGKVLDGWNRTCAAKAIGWSTIRTTNFDHHMSAQQFVISMNLIRRHLTDGQRAMIAAKLANMGRGGDRSKPQFCGLNQSTSVREAADQMKVAQRSVELAKQIAKADPAAAKEVAEGKATLAEASRKAAAKKTADKYTDDPIAAFAARNQKPKPAPTEKKYNVEELGRLLKVDEELKAIKKSLVISNKGLSPEVMASRIMEANPGLEHLTATVARRLAELLRSKLMSAIVRGSTDFDVEVSTSTKAADSFASKSLSAMKAHQNGLATGPKQSRRKPKAGSANSMAAVSPSQKQ